MSWDQNASELWRWGEVGIRGSLVGEGRARGLSLGLVGGVVKRISFETLRLFSVGELSVLVCELRGVEDRLTSVG
jgi:hypothetical protein